MVKSSERSGGDYRYGWREAGLLFLFVSHEFDDVKSFRLAYRFVMGDLILFDRDELGIIGALDVDEQVIGVRGGTNQFVKFQLKDGLVSALRVLDNEQHHERDSAYDR